MNPNGLLLKSMALFDHTYEPVVTIYDHLPYYRDVDVCPDLSRGLISGNVIKFYQYRYDPLTPVKVGR